MSIIAFCGGLAAAYLAVGAVLFGLTVLVFRDWPADWPMVAFGFTIAWPVMLPLAVWVWWTHGKHF